MTKHIKYILILFLFWQPIYGQRIIHGIILDQDSLPFIGVTINENTADYRTITDTNGRFELLIPTDTTCLKISFIGYLDTVLCDLPDSITLIKLFPDIKSINDINIFSVNYQYVDNTMISLYSAVIYNPFGIACSNFTSYLFKIPLMTVAQLDYRTDFKNNNDFHFGLARYHGDNHNNFHFGLSYDYEIITINDSKANLDYLSHKFNSTWTYKRTTLFMGYGYSEKDKMYYNGLLSSISFDFPKIDVSLFTRLNYWFDYLEYSVDIYKGIPTTNINLSAGYRQIDDINEINIKISYEIRH